MGVVLAGVILGHAAVIHAGLNAVQTQAYGSEARGTDAKSEVIISDGPIRYPKVTKSDYAVLMSQKAYDSYISEAKKGSVVIVDPDLVNSDKLGHDYEILNVPAMRLADELGNRMVSNMVMLGALVAKSGVFPLETLEKAIGDMVPQKVFEINAKAIRMGAGLV
jgi:2-oxoglutarate ferredoxin oxidoreductase subunit gamma